MAEIAGGAVRSLLGVIRDEMYRLGRVEGDVQFIKEEMESMNSFLMHLARTTPPGREHDEQVRTWMKQVRELAHDCNNSIDRYLRQGDPAVYRARSSMGYLWWVPWYLRKLTAQHLAASELHELKARARDVGERRLRYGVKVPAEKGKQETPPMGGMTTQVTAAGLGQHTDEEDIESPDGFARTEPVAFAEPHLQEECTQELVRWLKESPASAEMDKFPAIAIVDPDKEDGAEVVRNASGDGTVRDKFKHKLWINVTGCDGPLEILKQIRDMLIPRSREREVSEQVLFDGDVKEKEIHDKMEDIRMKSEERLRLQDRSQGLLDIICEILSPGTTDDALSKKILETINADKPRYEEKMKEIEHKTKFCMPPEPKEIKVVAIKGVTESRPTCSKQQQQRRHGKIDEYQMMEEKIKQTTEKTIAKMLRQMLPQSHDHDVEDADQRAEDIMIMAKIQGVLKSIKDQLLNPLIEEQTIKINEHLKGRVTLIILEGATLSSLNNWEEISCALSKLNCAPGSAVIVTTKESKDAKNYCNPARGPIIFSLVAFYCEKAQNLVAGEDLKSILGEILKKCEPSEFCMKMFVGALYAHRNRSKEELQRLSAELSYTGSDEAAKATKMIKFFYNELHRDYKACLLYLAIFPTGYEISRSRLVARWVVEGLIACEDWNKSVGRANQCFYELANRWLVCPGVIGAAGKVKSCTLDKRVHDFITKMAKEEHIRDTRLSHELACHFSIRSNIRLRTSERIGDFLKDPPRASSQLQLLKVLDLEGCGSLKEKQKYLKNVCNMVILLKFLSLRNTHISKLPKEINKLQQLEVLDIRQTCLGINSIKHLMLTKLKHLLAESSVLMPDKTGRMTGLEVVSHVQAPRQGRELEEIRELWQLRKLGVAIQGDQLNNLLLGIIDLHECLQSLSIVIKPGAVLKSQIRTEDFKPPRFLKSLRIRGNSSEEGFQMPEDLLPLLTTGNQGLSKVTLHNTSLSQGDMKLLSKLGQLSNLRLQQVNVSEPLTFSVNRFPALRHLLVEGGNILSITFKAEATPKLEKIVWSFGSAERESLGGTKFLPNLRHVEFNGNIIPATRWNKT